MLFAVATWNQVFNEIFSLKGSIFFFKRQNVGDDNGRGSSKRNKSNESLQVPQPNELIQRPQVPQFNELTFDLNDFLQILPKFTTYHPNQSDKIRTYLIKGPCQSWGHDFQSKLFGKKLRHFVVMVWWISTIRI